MLKLLAIWWANRKYLFNEYVEAETNDIKARVVESRVVEMKSDAKQLNAEAEEIESNIKREETSAGVSGALRTGEVRSRQGKARGRRKSPRTNVKPRSRLRKSLAR